MKKFLTVLILSLVLIGCDVTKIFDDLNKSVSKTDLILAEIIVQNWLDESLEFQMKNNFFNQELADIKKSNLSDKEKWLKVTKNMKWTEEKIDRINGEFYTYNTLTPDCDDFSRLSEYLFSDFLKFNGEAYSNLGQYVLSDIKNGHVINVFYSEKTKLYIVFNNKEMQIRKDIPYGDARYIIIFKNYKVINAFKVGG